MRAIQSAEFVQQLFLRRQYGYMKCATSSCERDGGRIGVEKDMSDLDLKSFWWCVPGALSFRSNSDYECIILDTIYICDVPLL